MAKRHIMTARRKAALRKAQLISARKRVGKHFGSSKKLSKGHKRAIGVAVAGAVIATGAYGTSAWMNEKKRKARIEFIKKNRDQAKVER